MDYTIIGGAVDLASRLQGLAEPGGIVLSYETWSPTKDVVRAEARAPVRVKGIRRELVPHRVVGIYDELESAGRVLRRAGPGLELRIDLEQLSAAGAAQDAGTDREAAIRDLREVLRILERSR